MIQRDAQGRPRVVPPRSTGAPPPASGGGVGGAGGGGSSTPGTPGTGGTQGREGYTLAGGPGRGSEQQLAQQSQGPGTVGVTPFMQSPGVQVGAMRGYDPGQQFSSQRVTGETISNDPWVSAALQNFAQVSMPRLQNQATAMGLGRSSTALNSQSNAMMQSLLPLYSQAAGLEENRINRMMQQGQFEAGLSQQNLGRLGESVESELARRERSANNASQANQNMIQNLMAMSGNRFNQQQQVGQGLMGAGQTYRDIAQQGNNAAMQDFLRRQALGEQAVYAPFGGLAQGGLGSTTSSTGK